MLNVDVHFLVGHFVCCAKVCHLIRIVDCQGAASAVVDVASVAGRRAWGRTY